MDSDLESASPQINLPTKRSESEQRELDEFEEEERKILSQESQVTSGLAFAIPGRWTGGKREEDEMRRLMAVEAAEAKARGELLEETSASDWSSGDEPDKDKDNEVDDLQPPTASEAAKETENLLNIPKKKREDTGNEADMDDTSMSSRASSRMLESINVMSMDSMNVM